MSNKLAYYLSFDALVASNPVTAAPESAEAQRLDAVEQILRAVPFYDFLEEPKKKALEALFDGPGMTGDFVFKPFRIGSVKLAKTTRLIGHHVKYVLGRTYGFATVMLYAYFAAKENALTPEAEAWCASVLKMVAWLTRIVHEGTSLGGYKPEVAEFHAGIDFAVKLSKKGKPLSVLAYLEGDKPGTPAIYQWYATVKQADEDPDYPAGAKRYQADEALKIVCKEWIGETLNDQEVALLMFARRVNIAMADMESGKAARFAGLPFVSDAFAPLTLGQFAGMCGLMRRASKGILVQEWNKDLFGADALDPEAGLRKTYAETVEDGEIEAYFGSDSLIAQMLFAAKNAHCSIAAFARKVSKENELASSGGGSRG